MKTLGEFLGHITLFTLVVMTSLTVSFFGVYVVLSLAHLYSLSFITQFSFVQMYGIWLIVGLFTYRYKIIKKDNTEELYSKALKSVFILAFYYLTCWGLGFLIFNILN
jgi:hypothetical protein